MYLNIGTTSVVLFVCGIWQLRMMALKNQRFLATKQAAAQNPLRA